MLFHLIKFDILFYTKKKSFYAMLLFFFGFGVLTALVARFPFANTYKNAPYVLSWLTGLMSLSGIFAVTLLAAQGLFRESEHKFEQILYAAPLRKAPYLAGRFLVVWGIGALCLALFSAGMASGHLRQPDPSLFGPFHAWHYVQPFLLLSVPNLFICAAVVCAVGWITRNKLLVYIAGLFIYIFYMVGSMYGNSPMIAGSSPVSAASMQLAARLDPFGIAAFYEQTRYWSAPQRNTQLIALEGGLLFNRLLYAGIGILLIAWAYRSFQFTLRTGRKGGKATPVDTARASYTPGKTPALHSDTLAYRWKVFYSFVRLDLKSALGGIPFLLLAVGWAFLLGMEIYSDIDGGMRMPQRIANTVLTTRNIIGATPVLAWLTLIFYSGEIFWRSRAARFDALENATPMRPIVAFAAKCAATAAIPLLLTLWSVGIGVAFQLLYGHTDIDWARYAMLCYILGLPFALTAVLNISLHALLRNKYVAMALAGLIFALTNTPLGKMAGLRHPLWQFARPLQSPYSEMNGFDQYLSAFHWQMGWQVSLAGLLAIWASGASAQTSGAKALRGLFAAGALICGSVVFLRTDGISPQTRYDLQQAYETRYKAFENLPQPSIVGVKTQIDLFPEENAYVAKGEYALRNETQHPIDTALLYCDPDLKWEIVAVDQADVAASDPLQGCYRVAFRRSLGPGDSTVMRFRFRYRWTGFEPHLSFNSIIKNGTFIRLSNYYPRFGYQPELEIEDPEERKKRGMPPAPALKPLNAPDDAPYAFIQLDMTVSTSGDQTAVGTGELIRQWREGDRNYFHYESGRPIPFRFALSSARYARDTLAHRGRTIEALYHPGHGANAARLLENARQTLDYCEAQFGPYPFKTVRFAEISSFTSGFAGTAYPVSFFINEGFGFQSKAEADPQKDLINELSSHELSHAWWGNTQIAPDGREGGKILTETLAMYSELMLYKQTYGEAHLLHRVNVHRDLYLSQRAFLDEEPLYRSHPAKPHLCYNKGMVVMYQLYCRLGEEKINRALRSLLQKHAYPQARPLSSDLVAALCAAGDSAAAVKVDELFRQIVVYDLKLLRATARATPSGAYALDMEASAIRYDEDGKGAAREIPMNEPVEADIYFDRGAPKRVVWQAVGGRIKASLELSEQPRSVALDPRLLFLDKETENNEKAVERE